MLPVELTELPSMSLFLFVKVGLEMLQYNNSKVHAYLKEGGG